MEHSVSRSNEDRHAYLSELMACVLYYDRHRHHQSQQRREFAQQNLHQLHVNVSQHIGVIDHVCLQWDLKNRFQRQNKDNRLFTIYKHICGNVSE